MDKMTILRVIAGLLSEDGENTEYDRACTEIAMHVLGTDMEDDMRYAVRGFLRNLNGGF